MYKIPYRNRNSGVIMSNTTPTNLNFPPPTSPVTQSPYLQPAAGSALNTRTPSTENLKLNNANTSYAVPGSGYFPHEDIQEQLGGDIDYTKIPQTSFDFKFEDPASSSPSTESSLPPPPAADVEVTRLTPLEILARFCNRIEEILETEEPRATTVELVLRRFNFPPAAFVQARQLFELGPESYLEGLSQEVSEFWESGGRRDLEMLEKQGLDESKDAEEDAVLEMLEIVRRRIVDGEDLSDLEGDEDKTEDDSACVVGVELDGRLPLAVG